MILGGIILVLAGGLIIQEFVRRKERAILVARIDAMQSQLGVSELKREVDGSFQNEHEIVSEAIDMENELRTLTQKKQEYYDYIKSVKSRDKQSGADNDSSMQLVNDDDYDAAF